MIRRVFIRGYKSLYDVDLELKPLTVLIGPNASGKSNLLDAIGLLSRIATVGPIKTAFEEHRGQPLEAFFIPSGGGLAESLERESLQFTLGVDVQLSEGAVAAVENLVAEMRQGLPTSDGAARGRPKKVIERNLQYQVTVEFVTSSGLLRVVDETLVALRKDGQPSNSRKAFVERVGGRLHLRMEGQAHPTYHDIGLDHTIVSTPLYVPHYPHIAAFREELRRWQFYYFDPGVMREDTPLKYVDSLRSDGKDLAGFFHTLKQEDHRQFENLVRSLSVTIPGTKGLVTDVTREGLVRLLLRDSGTLHSSGVISDGTLRVLGLFAILAPQSHATTIGFEEPENGVHPRRLQIIARLLDSAVGNDPDKQIIITTHSSKLPDHMNYHRSTREADSENGADVGDAGPVDPVFLVLCSKEDGRTKFDPINEPLFAQTEVERSLEEMLTRGDLGG